MSIEQMEALLAAGGVEGEEDLAEEPEEAEEAENPEEGPAEEEEPEEETEEPEPQEVEVDAEVLAQALGVEESDIVIGDDGKVAIRAKVNGEELKTSLADLRKSYQLQKNLDDKAHKLNQEREQFTAWQQNQAQKFEQEVAIADQMVERQAEQLAERYRAVDWDRLRAADPAEWAARRQEFTSAYNGLKTQKADLQAQYVSKQQELMQQSEVARKEQLQKESQLLAEKLPEWSDQSVATQEQQALASYLRGMGYSDEELNIGDHRAILIARKAMLYDKQAGATPAGKKVRKVAKVMPSGSQKTTAQKTRKQRKDKYDRLRKSGSERDALDVLVDMID